MSLATVTAKLRGRKVAEPTPWDQSPDWQRAQQQAEALQGELRNMERAQAAAQSRVTELRTRIEAAEVAAILGDSPPDSAEGARVELAAAERALAENGRRADQLRAALRELEARMAKLQRELKQQFAARWREVYAEALKRAAQKAQAASDEQDELARLWALGAESVGANTPPGPLPTLRVAAGGPLAQWLAAVKAYTRDA
jgi:chromosome segregation ATPase